MASLCSRGIVDLVQVGIVVDATSCDLHLPMSLVEAMEFIDGVLGVLGWGGCVGVGGGGGRGL